MKIKNLANDSMREVKFEHISDAYFLYWNMYLKYRKYEFNQGEIPAYFILDNIFSSFLVEIGLKALAVYENKQIKNNHNLDYLFNQLSLEMQNIVAKESNIELIELKEKLKKNAEHFQHWRYYYELKADSFNIKLFEKLLTIITALLEVLRGKQINTNN